ncbi:MAG: hypothetical protein A3C90_01210 [Candidatus Magasanikbacteria bacterium RIFCSPHIGHO2_02_FULL_51_14]|uniref:Uncharacterized protein n=1 Tax=Candidatus Magasanikbacteria bacterium RIFCSPHIGHO2_02_FULL_51_14 TaxID=1798683 RepID=A0A1F6MQ50_9BACT|nr:MAG: hypothetical protein A3C90_01210 [Candidatus Magasanikbacteria bacterium RIFCSPHIGHO2_02_FULL_51_14]
MCAKEKPLSEDGGFSLVLEAFPSTACILSWGKKIVKVKPYFSLGRAEKARHALVKKRNHAYTETGTILYAKTT